MILYACIESTSTSTESAVTSRPATSHIMTHTTSYSPQHPSNHITARSSSLVGTSTYSMSSLVSSMNTQLHSANTSSIAHFHATTSSSSEQSISSIISSSIASSDNPSNLFWSRTNYKMILGVSFGIFGLISVLIVVTCSTVLIVRKRKKLVHTDTIAEWEICMHFKLCIHITYRRRKLELRYKRLVSFDEGDEDDDED